ncbi:MAG: nucleotidyltransferase domain-containing protein [Nitrospirae bacterium]|nr:nucleotidyltransferase domain-containing protein [Nitrospirota bacterium]
MTKTAIKQSQLSRDVNASIVKKLKTFFMERRDTVLVFLFGSFASRQMTRKSDIDIGILFGQQPGFYELSDMKENLSALLKRDVDLVVLNDASPILRMQVLKKGRIVYRPDKKYYSEFYGDTVKQYDDLKQIRKKCEEGILKGRIYA